MREMRRFSKIAENWLQMRPIEDHNDFERADYVMVLADDKLSEFIKPFSDDRQ